MTTRKPQTEAKRIRIVIQDGVTDDELLVIASNNHWYEEDRFPEEKDKPFEIVYSTRDDLTKLHWIEDQRIGVKSILVTGVEAERVADIVRDSLGYLSLADSLRRARSSKTVGDDRRAALYHLALNQVELGFDESIFKIYARALVDKDPIVRGAGVTSTIYLAWPQFAEPLRALATADEPDESIRHDAALIASRLAAR